MFMSKTRVRDWEQLAAVAHYDAKELACLCNESIRQLQRDFHRQFGLPPQVWLNVQRLKAAELRLTSGESVKKVAMDLGYKQTSHFCRQFKNYYHLTPTQFAISSQNMVACG